MARARITEISEDLISDSGSVLFSFVKGEQQEYPITINFISDVNAGYTFEAVVVEAANVLGDPDIPVTVQPSGVSTTLQVRKPVFIGVWDAGQAYNMEEVVLYNAACYKLSSGAARVSSVAPSEDATWVSTSLNKIYVQFLSTLGSTWNISPRADAPVYGFFELRVTEPNNSVFRRTWKPIRGMVELLFSPTDLVADV